MLMIRCPKFRVSSKTLHVCDWSHILTRWANAFIRPTPYSIGRYCTPTIKHGKPKLCAHCLGCMLVMLRQKYFGKRITVGSGSNALWCRKCSAVVWIIILQYPGPISSIKHLPLVTNNTQTHMYVCVDIECNVFTDRRVSVVSRL